MGVDEGDPRRYGLDGSALYDDYCAPEGWQRIRYYPRYRMANINIPNRPSADVTSGWSGAIPGGMSSYPLDDDGSYLSGQYPQLRDGIERFFITDINNPAAGAEAQSSVAVMFDAWSTGAQAGVVPGRADEPSMLNFNHSPGGANVLFMDGHVEFIRYNERYPVMWLDPNDSQHQGKMGTQAHNIMPYYAGMG